MNNPNAKVLFRVPDGDGGDGAIVETLWAESLGDDRYKLDNVPFYAYDVSWNDIVLAPFNEAESMPTFEAVVVRAGHRTVRVKFETPTMPGNAADGILTQLVALGCSYEGASKHYLAVDIPPEVDAEQVFAYLAGQSVAEWEHADPSYERRYPEG